MRAVSPMCFRAAMSKGGDWIARSSLTTCTTGSTYTTRGPPTASPNAPTSSSPSAQHSVGRRTASRPTHTLLVRRSKPWAWSLKKGRTIAGPALTLQCMPKREGLYGQAEYDEPGRQLHRHVLYPNKPGDVVVVDARGDLSSSIFGEMMLTFFAGRGSVSMVIDVHPDSAQAAELDLGIWVKDVMPNFHAQTNIISTGRPSECRTTAIMPRMLRVLQQ